MPGQLFEIAVDDPVRARAALGSMAGLSGITAFGQRLHVALADAARDLPAVTTALAASGVRAGEPRHIVPSLEDVFISVIQGARSRR